MANIVVPAISASVRTAPSAPPAPTAADVGTGRAYDDGAVNVTIGNPTWDGKLPVTTWKATPSVGSVATDIDNVVQVTGLDTTGGPSRTFTASVGNAVGFSGDSTSSNAVAVTSVPDAMSAPTPTVSTATRVNLAFTAPNNGGKTITSYTVESNPSISLTYSGIASPLAVTGTYAANTEYTFRIRATNANGSGIVSAYSSSVTPNPTASVPGIPTNISVSVIDTNTVRLSFTAPSDGGSAITAYTIETNPARTLTYNSADLTSPIDVDASYVQGTAYQFRIAAVNAIGTGTFSAYSASVTPFPITVPNAPTSPGVTVTDSNTVSVTFTTPTDNGGATITGYTIQSDPSISLTYSTSDVTSPISVDGSFVAGTAYRFRLAANNSVGTGTYSSYTTTVTPNPATLPGTPTGVSASVIDSNTARISFTAPSNGGSTITGYAIESGQGISLTYNTLDATSPIDVDASYVFNTGYTFRIAAINSVGQGPWSAYTTSIIPNGPTVPTAPTILTPSVVSTTAVDVNFNTPSSNGGATITGYVVEVSPSVTISYSGTDTVSPIRVTATYGVNTDYTFRVAAKNSVGTGPFSSYSVAVMPNYDPNQPI